MFNMEQHIAHLIDIHDLIKQKPSSQPGTGVARCTFCGRATASYDPWVMDDLALILDLNGVTISVLGEMRERSKLDRNLEEGEVEWPCARCYGRRIHKRHDPSEAPINLIWRWRRAGLLWLRYRLSIDRCGWKPTTRSDLERVMNYVLSLRYVATDEQRRQQAYPHWSRLVSQPRSQGEELARDLDAVLCLASLRLR